jgi:hypothetical protein
MQNILKLLPGTKTKISNELLRKWNITLVALYAIQGGLILLLSSAHYLQISSLFTANDTLQTKLTGDTVMAPAIHQLVTINLVGLVAAFIFISAILHLLAATIYRTKYEAWLKKDVNPLRWSEYSLSGGVILVVIGLLTGISDSASLLMLFAFAVIVGLSGFMIEVRRQQPKRKLVLQRIDKYIIGIAAIIPWIVIGLYVIGSNIFGAGIPSFLYVIYLSTLLFFIAIAANFYLMQTRKGGWKSYAYGECWHMGLSLVVQSLLAWQIFIDVLHP